jgi:Immunoglobulin I-set domain
MKMTVTVKKFEKDDVGSYRCIAKNSLGEVDSSIRLYGKSERVRAFGFIFSHQFFNIKK